MNGAWGDGAFSLSQKPQDNSAYNGNTTKPQSANFNASNCSNRYGAYTEVNPLYESCLICIRY